MHKPAVTLGDADHHVFEVGFADLWVKFHLFCHMQTSVVAHAPMMIPIMFAATNVILNAQ